MLRMAGMSTSEWRPYELLEKLHVRFSAVLIQKIGKK